jgi:mRNA-degrading endonuclease RelE of RelBE toxin-antitoxin system
MFKIEFTKKALKDMRSFKKFEQTLIVDETEKNLLWEPTKQVRNRKPLRPNDLAKWELRIDKYRVFYDVDEHSEIVKVKAVGWKEHDKLYIGGKEHEL